MNNPEYRLKILPHPRFQGATILTGVFKEEATKVSGKLKRKKDLGQDSE